MFNHSVSLAVSSVAVTVGLTGLSPVAMGLAGFSPVSAGQTDWRVPVTSPARLIKNFRSPNSDYSAGHRGLDYLVQEGQAVLAPAQGRIAFVGFVANKPVMAIEHPNGYRSAFEPVCPSLSLQTYVQAGQIIGSICGANYASHCQFALCLHFSLRHSGSYLSPSVFIGGLAPSVLVPITH